MLATTMIVPAQGCRCYGSVSVIALLTGSQALSYAGLHSLNRRM